MCFCLGEIDCRCHINLHVSESVSYEQVIDDLVLRYESKLRSVKNLFDSIHVCVFMIPPPPQQGMRHEWGEYSPRGTDAERLAYAKYFNAALQKMCDGSGFHFIHAYDKYADEDGFILASKTDGICHMKDPEPVRQIVQALTAPKE